MAMWGPFFATRDNHPFIRAALACAIGLAIAMAWTPVMAADDDDDLPDTKIYNSILEGLGLKHDGPGIVYRERSPLVIPPSRALTPPVQSATATNPNWPVDPEVKLQRELKANSSRGTTAEIIEQESWPLRPDQLSPGRRTARSRSSGPGSDSVDQGIGRPLSPSELGYKGGLFGSLFGKDKEETAVFTGEPARTSLTAPPPGYQTPSPSQPYGVGKDRTKTKPTKYLEEHPSSGQ
jgi:hypothetical protein